MKSHPAPLRPHPTQLRCVGRLARAVLCRLYTVQLSIQPSQQVRYTLARYDRGEMYQLARLYIATSLHLSPGDF